MLPEDTFGSSRESERSPELARWSLVSVVMLGFWLAALGVAVLLPQLRASGEKRLPVAESSPKLNLTSAEAEPIALVQAERPVVPEVQVEPPVVPPPIPMFDLPLPLPTVNTSPPIPEVEVKVEEEPADFAYLVAQRAHPLGDTPMMRTWKLLSASTILVTLLSTPAPAQDDLNAVKSEIMARLDKMDKSITESFKKAAKDIADLRIDVTSLQGDSLSQRTEMGKTNMRVEKLEIQLSQMQADLSAIRKRLETPALYPPSGDRIDELKKQLSAIEQAIANMGGIAQVSKSSPSTGRVMLVNMYPEDLLFVVNQKNIRVLPGQSMPLDNMMAGSLTYEVISPTWGLRARNTTMLNANETLTLTAR